jgi:hypothetical protein
MRRILIFVLFFGMLPTILPAQSAEDAPGIATPMSVERLAAILSAIDPEAVIEARGITLTVASVPVTVIVDPNANRMRILVPISSAETLSEAELMRLMQANFDSALDARYAIANNRLWSTFIHPLAELQGDQLISGLAQTVTLAQTYGDTYSSGALVFGGGDTRSLIEELRRLGEEL